MIFNNRENKCFKVIDNGKERLVWESRSVAVNGTIIVSIKFSGPYVLVSRRGKKAADYHGLMNVVAGYLDWDETGKEAFFRETWEECGLDLEKLIEENKVLITESHIEQPWHVETNPSASRQNVSLRYGVHINIDDDKLPELSLENNEVEDEVESCWWMPIDEIDKHEWAFKHDDVIKSFLFHIGIGSHKYIFRR